MATFVDQSIEEAEGVKSTHSTDGPEQRDTLNINEILDETEDSVKASQIIANGHAHAIPAEKIDNPKELLTYQELPPWSQHNPHLLTAYRPVSNSFKECLTSILLSSHNEYLNIYTHIASALVYLALLIKWIYEGFWTPLVPFEEKCVTATFLLCCVLCFLFSTIYHIFNSHSERVMCATVKMDYIGIVLIILGSTYPWLYYAHSCGPWYIKVSYYVFTLITGITASVASTFERFNKCNMACLRCAVFSTFALSCLSGAVHAIASKGFTTVWFKFSGQYLAYMFVVYIIGAVFYTSHIPERFWPRKFDVLCPSHALFHVSIPIGAFIHYMGILDMYNNRETLLSCACNCEPVAS